MALKSFKPITPGLRQLVIVDRSELYKGKPVKALTEGQSSKGGRNNHGRITVRFRGGGHKQAYRIVDFKRAKRDMPAKVLAEYPRYLKALSLRGERAQRDPVKDQARMLELKPFADALAAADPAHPEAQALRWELEELRVQLFAQELGVKGGVSPKRLAARLHALTSG